jgi:hypothetical protein
MLQWTCGTAACAAGYLSLLPAFQEQGLRARNTGDPAFDDETGFVALERFFDVTPAVAEDWFFSFAYLGLRPGPKDVAARMRAYLRHHGEETGTVAPRKADRRPHFLSGVVRG